MKKTYIAPEMNVMEMESESLMLTVSPEGSLNDLKPFGGNATGLDADAQGRRGSWGNLWD